MTDRPKHAEMCGVTARSPGAVGTVQVSGPEALEIVRAHFRGKRRPVPGDSIYLGNLFDPAGEVVDEVLLCCFPPEESPTGEALVEIHCHGGPATMDAVLGLLRRSGVSAVPPEDWRRKLPAFSRRIEARALELFLSSRTDLSARIFLHQMRGGLRREISRIASLCEADTAGAEAAISSLLASFPLGRALANPPQVVLAGRPNVGKSTLFNCLLKKERSLIAPEPGTTRDAIRDMASIWGIPFGFIDTAGLRESGDSVELLGMERTRRVLRTADRVVWMFDASEPPAPADIPAPGSARAIAVLNKIDLPENHLAAHLARMPQAIPISALTGTGIDRLEDALLQDIRIPDLPAPVLFESSQEETLRSALLAIQRKETPQAILLCNSLLE